MTALRQLLSTLARVQGDKTVILISGGWPLDEHDESSLMTTLAADAAAARVKLFTIFVPRSFSASRRTISLSPRSDRNLFSCPLENLAGVTGGRPYSAEVGAETIFDRLAGELASYYRIGVEKNASDVGANGRRMKVKVARDGVVPDDRLALEVELEGERAKLANADVVFEIAAEPDEPALIQTPASLATGRRDTSMTGQAVAEVRILPPGEYLARVKVRSGNDALGDVRRTFAILEPADHAAEETAVATAVAPTGSTPAALALRGRAVAALPPFALERVMSRDVFGMFLERVAARPDGRVPGGLGDLLARARTGDITSLNVSDAQAAQNADRGVRAGIGAAGANQTDSGRPFFPRCDARVAGFLSRLPRRMLCGRRKRQGGRRDLAHGAHPGREHARGSPSAVGCAATTRKGGSRIAGRQLGAHALA